ncbi:coiled-coil domain-containing protein 157-like isoform X2 [Bolinopsis microptera]|uniref:coiled-coil domain-containing protein 157-like isoform X2 n=1 Tax=Bolinopsis microptera TaxID=2820187 RepID=UPI003079042F
MDGIVTSSEFNNLKQDLLSVQDTIGQIFGKIGSLQTKSWKLREESGDLPVQLLSNKCQYFSSDLHATRASHIMLLELIVDRLALMLQSYMYFSDRLVGKPAGRIIEKAPNLGPLCKKYWKKAKLLRQFVTSLQAEIQRKSEELVNMGLTLDQAYEENTLLKDMVVKHGLAGGYDTPQRNQQNSGPNQAPKTAGSVPWSDFGMPVKGEEESMADSAVDMVRSSATSLVSQVKLPTQITVNNMKTVSKWLMQGTSSAEAKTQTVETAFVECNVCSSIQDLLEVLGSKVTMTWNMLLQHAKPPKRLIMSPPREAIKWCEYHTTLITEVDTKVRQVQKTSTDLQRTCEEQRNRILNLESVNAVLKSEVDSLQSVHSGSVTESSKREEMLKQQISKQAVEYHHNLEQRRVEEERLKEKIAGLETKLADYQDKYFCEATSKREIMDQLSEVRREAEKAKLMNQTCRKLSEQIRTLESEHHTVQDELNRYQTRNDQLIKQNKMLTIKQGQLLSQLEAFDQECENMRDQLEAARDSTSNTTCELSDVVKQKEQLYNENTRLLEAIEVIQSDISNLTKTLSKKDRQLNDAQKIIEEEREKETTLISYPLLVEGERIPKELNRLVQANNIRILRLEEQNRLLRDTSLQQELYNAQPPKEQKPNPQPLWSNKCFKELVKSQHVFERVFTPIDYYDGIKSLVDAHGKVRPGSCPEGKKGGGLSQSPDKVIPPHNSPLPISKSPHPTNPAWNKTKSPLPGIKSLNTKRTKMRR